VLDRVAERYAPLMVWGGHMPDHIHRSVGSDNRLGGLMATRHLLEIGRRKLAFFGTADAPELAQRRQGFFEACHAAGLGDDVETLPVHLTPDAAYAMIAERLDAGPPPDGIVAVSDVVAMAALRALAERGLRVPQDVAVIGYDDVMLAAHTSPPLTTIRQDLAQGAGLLVDLLLRGIAGEATESAVLAPTLIIRGSTETR